MHVLQKAIIFSISFCIPSFAMIIPTQPLFSFFNDLKDCKKNVIEHVDDMRSMMQVNQECFRIVKDIQASYICNQYATQDLSTIKFNIPPLIFPTNMGLTYVLSPNINYFYPIITQEKVAQLGDNFQDSMKKYRDGFCKQHTDFLYASPLIIMALQNKKKEDFAMVINAIDKNTVKIFFGDNIDTWPIVAVLKKLCDESVYRLARNHKIL